MVKLLLEQITDYRYVDNTPNLIAKAIREYLLML